MCVAIEHPRHDRARGFYHMIAAQVVAILCVTNSNNLAAVDFNESVGQDLRIAAGHHTADKDLVFCGKIDHRLDDLLVPPRCGFRHLRLLQLNATTMGAVSDCVKTPGGKLQVPPTGDASVGMTRVGELAETESCR